MKSVSALIPSNQGFATSRQGSPKLFLPNPFLKLAIIFFTGLVLFVFMMICLRNFLATYRLAHDGVRVNGSVVATERVSAKSSYSYRVTYTYVVDGIERSNTDSNIRPSDGDGLRVNGKVPIVYSAGDPSVARLGTPARLWGPGQGLNGALLLMTLVGTLVALYLGREASKEVQIHRRLCRDGHIVVAEAVSWERKPGYRGKVDTEIVYRLTLEGGSAIGRAVFTTQGDGPIRRVRAGEPIPVLFLNENTHRPL